MPRHTYHFAEFRLDPASRELRRGEEELPLQLKVFDCILYLLEHRDRAVGRDELISAVWGGVHLSDSVLGKAISFARDALGDTVEEQRFIKTIRGYGYRWAAPVQSVAEPAATDASIGSERRARLWLVAVALGVVALTAVGLYLMRSESSDELGGSISRPVEGSIALLLPVTVDAKAEEAWMRLGLMDHIAGRLRAAEQAMVPSDTVIALLRGGPEDSGPEEIEALTTGTGAQLVLDARARPMGARWRVSLRSLVGAKPPLEAIGEADDVLGAASLAADRMALSLGLMPATESDAESGPALLVRQIEAAILAQQMDLARELIASADAEVRERPEIRLQRARIEYSSLQLDTAERIYESLLDEPLMQRDPVLRANVLRGLGAVAFSHRNHDAAEAMFEKAVRSLDPDSTLSIHGGLRRSLGYVALVDGRFDVARTQLARARRIFESTGDVRRLAVLDNDLGILQALRDRYVEALDSFERSADARAALHDLGGELRNRVNAVEMRLGLLDPQTALALEPRLNELLARMTSPELVALGDLGRVALLAANGRSRAAANVLAESSRALEARDDLPGVQTWASLLHAEQLVRDGDLAGASRVAVETVEQALSQHNVLLDDYLGRAWLISLRYHLSEGDLIAAEEIESAIERWAARTPTRAAEVYAALAHALVAAGRARDSATEDAFTRALTLVESGHAPVRLLQVAEEYVHWLLIQGPEGTADPQRALVVGDRVAQYADRDFRAALLQLRVYHALGPPSAWRAALTRTRGLAGEREIPPQLPTVPERRRQR